MPRQYYLRGSSGEAEGPLSGQQVKAAAAGGLIGPNDELSVDGKSWRRASAANGLVFGKRAEPEPQPKNPREKKSDVKIPTPIVIGVVAVASITAGIGGFLWTSGMLSGSGTIDPQVANSKSSFSSSNPSEKTKQGRPLATGTEFLGVRSNAGAFEVLEPNEDRTVWQTESGRALQIDLPEQSDRIGYALIRSPAPRLFAWNTNGIPMRYWSSKLPRTFEDGEPLIDSTEEGTHRWLLFMYAEPSEGARIVFAKDPADQAESESIWNDIAKIALESSLDPQLVRSLLSAADRSPRPFPDSLERLLEMIARRQSDVVRYHQREDGSFEIIPAEPGHVQTELNRLSAADYWWESGGREDPSRIIAGLTPLNSCFYYESFVARQQTHTQLATLSDFWLPGISEPLVRALLDHDALPPIPPDEGPSPTEWSTVRRAAVAHQVLTQAARREPEEIAPLLGHFDRAGENWVDACDTAAHVVFHRFERNVETFVAWMNTLPTVQMRWIAGKACYNSFEECQSPEFLARLAGFAREFEQPSPQLLEWLRGELSANNMPPLEKQ